MKQGKFLPRLLVIGAILIAIFAIYGFAGIWSVALDSPANNSWTSNNDVTFNCTAVLNTTETALGNITLRIWNSAGAYVYHTGNQSPVFNATTNGFLVTDLSDAQYVWNCEAFNVSGSSLSASTNRTLWVDTTKPYSIILGNISNGLNTTIRNHTFNWTAIDNLATNFLCNLTINNVGNATVMVTNGSFNSTTVNNFPDGTYLWAVTCWDPTNASTNINTSESRRFTVDTVAPSNIEPNIANNTNFSSSSVAINWTTTDATSTVVNCSLVLDGVTNLTGLYSASASGSLASQLVTGLTEGQHNWYVNCTDIVGNANTTGTFNYSGYNYRSFYVDLTDPVVTLTLGSSSVVVMGTQTITCSATDNRDVTPAASFDVKLPNGDLSSDRDGTFTDTRIIGTYTVTCSSTDNSGRSSSTSSTFTVGSEVTSSSGGGSSSSSSIPSVSASLSLAPGEANSAKLSNANIPVSEIVFDVAEAVSNVRVTVQAFSSAPAGSVSAEGKVYKYLQITKTNLEDANLKSAKISFFVTKAWLTENGLDSSDVELKRYTTQWVSLPTIVKSSDATKVYFEAETPGFSTFAIGVKAAPAEEAPSEEAPAEEAPAEEAPAEKVPAEEAPVAPAAEAKASLTWLYVLIAVVVIGAVVAFVLMKKKKA